MARILVFSTLYPNAAQPNHGVFVENRLLHTLALGGAEATVLAPVPYFPSGHPWFGRYAAFARAPRREVRNGLEIWRPRYLVAPKIGSAWAPELLYRAALRKVRALQAAGQRFDVIDAHYFYPDGVAAARLGRALRLPLVITGRGSDLTVIPGSVSARSQIQWASRQANALVTVCEDLRCRLVALGAPEARTLVLRNGVDLERFAPRDRHAARAALGVSGFVLLSVGGLIPRKGHDLTLKLLTRYPDCTLLIAGSGPLRTELEGLARRLGLAQRVRFLGEVAHTDLPSVYAAADLMVLASSHEGWANVLLESMACGTPVLATDVNGAAEAVQSPAAGRLAPERSVDCLARTLEELRRDLPSRDETRRYAEGFSWRQTAKANLALLNAVAKHGYAPLRSDDPRDEHRGRTVTPVEQLR
jgi:glycosyltransferase involved in cell wall biosynthesis